MKNNTEVTILGRGQSLKKLNNFKSDCTDVILVNEHWKSPRNPVDYYKVPEISKFIKGKDLTLVCTPTTRDLSGLIKGLESEYNVKNKYNTVFPPGSGTDRDRQANGNWSCFPSECIEDYKYAHLSGKGCVRGSLAWSIILAINYYNAGKVNIFGLDFYEKEYLVPQNHNYEKEKTQVQSIKDDFSLLFKFFNKVQFSVYTLASYNPNLKNVNIL